MTRYRRRPSRPKAAMTAILGTVLLVFGTVQFVRGERFHWFFVAWLAVGLVIVGLSLWAWLGKGPELFTAESAITQVEEGGPDEPSVRVRPAKPVAVTSALVGVGALVYGIARFVQADRFSWFLVLLTIFGVSVIGFNLWAAFAKKGNVYRLDQED